jgi:hypothetical protein
MKTQIRHAGMDCRHPVRKDASGDIPVSLIPALYAGMTQLPPIIKGAR